MSLSILSGTAYLGVQIPLSSFPDLVREHLRENPATPNIEQLGTQLAAQNFPQKETAEFIREVCEWGNYAGTASRVLKDNPIAAICQSLQAATSILATGNSAAKALTQVNAIRGLGSPSFASKHLRFLRPDICPVFDSVLQEVLPYSFDPDGYADFCDDCASLTKTLAGSNFNNPRTRQGGVWFAADVEGALYMFARRL